MHSKCTVLGTPECTARMRRNISVGGAVATRAARSSTHKSGRQDRASGTVFRFVLEAKHWFVLNAQVKIGEEIRPLRLSRCQWGLGGKVEQGNVVRLHLRVQVGRVPAGIHERDEDVAWAFRTGIHTLLAQHPT
jgi:hypothetical protein